jgi:hypothetical protein
MVKKQVLERSKTMEIKEERNIDEEQNQSQLDEQAIADVSIKVTKNPRIRTGLKAGRHGTMVK